MTNFSNLNLPEFLLQKLNEIGYDKATDIQEKAIPVILEGKDLLASSQTGSGKTGAFTIPIIAKMESNSNLYSIIIVPTRELAIQIKDAIQKISDNKKINIALIFGGSDIKRQIATLKRKPNIVIATPGRLQDHVARRTIDLSLFNILVLDEFDRMLDMGFRDEISKIVAKLPANRQTLMFSATIRKSITEYAKNYLSQPVEITVAQKENTHVNIKQDFLNVSVSEKYRTLISEIGTRDGSILVFVNTKRCADDLMSALLEDGHASDAIHGDLRQREREKAIKYFREQKYRILIATDVVARGIDIPHVKHVINYDVPKTFEDYTHRIGRTGRGGASGFSLCFVTSSERKYYNNITMKLNSDESENPYQRQKKFDRQNFGNYSNAHRGRSYDRRERSSNDSRYSEKKYSGNRWEGSSDNRSYNQSGNKFEKKPVKSFNREDRGNRSSSFGNSFKRKKYSN
jgi:ATP-dependent RNA helicase DeaD